MAKSASKEIERVNKLYKNGEITKKEFFKLRNEAIYGKSSKQGHSLSEIILSIIAIIFFIVLVYGSGDETDTASNKAKSSNTKKLTDKQCTQIWKDKGYYLSVQGMCGYLENSDNFYRNIQSDSLINFDSYAQKHNCPQNNAEAHQITLNTQSVINKKIDEARSQNQEITFCESEKAYFSKVKKKYGIN